MKQMIVSEAPVLLLVRTAVRLSWRSLSGSFLFWKKTTEICSLSWQLRIQSTFCAELVVSSQIYTDLRETSLKKPPIIFG